MRPVIGIPVGSDRRPVVEFRLRAPYTLAVLAAGGVPLLVPPMPAPGPAEALSRLDGLLLAGGGDVAARRYGARDSGRLVRVDPERDELELHLTRLALEAGLPVLAICRGVQVLNVAGGGTLIQDIPSELPGALAHASPADLPADHAAHTVRLCEGSRLARVYGASDEVWVNSRHHQGVRDAAPGLRAVAHAADGVVEGLEPADARRPFVVGVQWHPEDLAPKDAATRALFSAFVLACSGDDR